MNIYYLLMKEVFIIFKIMIILTHIHKNVISKKIKKHYFNKNGIYFIKSLFNQYYLAKVNDKLILSKNLYKIKIIEIKSQIYNILFNRFQIIGIDKNNKIIIDKNINKKINWNLIKVNENQYLIKNKYNQKYMMVDKDTIKFGNIVNAYSKNIKKNFLFNIIKIFEVGDLTNKNHLDILEKEPIDVLIKYIDLNDKTLNRKGIKHIYKDFDNEELRYSIRSILQYIPWIRKIFILMPNKKVKYFKSAYKIKEKIIYITDKDLLGFDSANIFAFTFNLHKMEKFGLSKNFIYMEDDFFIGKPLNKSDFFYYDEKKKKVLPYILTKYFNEIDKNETLNKYYKLFKIKNTFHPHSKNGWNFSILSTNKFFIERYNYILTLFETFNSHNAIAENIDDLKDVFKEIKNYKYINQTLYSKERNVLTLNQPHFVNLYQLNIKHKKVHSIPYKYIEMENINNSNLNISLFVINTCGNNIPTKEQYKMQKHIMQKRFPIPTKYEKINTINIIFFFEYYLIIIFVIIKKYIKNKHCR